MYNTSIPKINKQQAKPVSRPSVTPQVVEVQGNSDPFGLSVIILTGTSGRRNCSEIELEYIKKFKNKKQSIRKTKTTSLTNLTKERVTITVQNPRKRKRKAEHHYSHGEDQYRYNFKYFI